MKKILSALLLTSFIISCNSGSEHGNETKDSLQQLLGNIRDSIRKYPGDPGLRFALAETLQEAGKYNEALSALDSANISKPDSANPYIFFDFLLKKTELLELAGDTVNAISTLEQFVHPGELTIAGLRLANLYAETKNPKTITVCDLMIKNDPTGKDPNPNYLKGAYYYNIDDYDKALREFDECIRKDYNFIDAYMEKGRILYKQKKYTDAIKVYDLALNVSNTFADAYLWKAKCEEAFGLKQEAKLNYQRAYGLDKTLTEAKEAADKL